jgi:uncharacterized alkaline shock family protein YloU
MEDNMTETTGKTGEQTSDMKGRQDTQVRGEVRTGRPGRAMGAELVTEEGRTTIADAVVEKVAGMAARQLGGVYALGSGATRAFGAIKEAMGSGPSPNTGVTVEVGERQAAIDLDITVEYGVSIIDLSQAVRRNVIDQVERMTGLEVTEVNIDVHDVHIADEGDDDSERR